MAIETTYFTGTTAAANYAEVSAWLTANAAEYFDTIDVPSGAQEVNCKVGDVTALKLDWGTEYNTQRSFQINAKNGANINSNYQYFHDRGCWRYGYKTDSGIVICNGKTDNYQASIFISKNNNGELIFAALRPDNPNINSCSNWAEIIDFNSQASIKFNSSNQGDPATRHRINGVLPASMTALVPIVSDVETYCDKIMITPFSQYNNMCWGVIDVSGTKYVYNGVFALKE